MCQIISWTGAGDRSTLASVLPHNRIITIISEPTVCVCVCAVSPVCPPAGSPSVGALGAAGSDEEEAAAC